MLDAGVIYGGSRNTAVFMWCFAIVWTALTLAVVVKHWHDAPGTGYRSPHLLLSLFPAGSVLLLLSAISLTQQAMKFGRSALTLTPLPPHPGEPLHVSVAVPRRLEADADCVIDLQCVHRTRRRGSQSSAMESIVWQDDRNLKTTTDGVTTLIDADFVLQPDAELTTKSSIATAVIWRLAVHVRLSGVDYRERFELPVFARRPGDAAPPALPAVTPPATSDISLASELGQQRIWLQTFAGGSVRVDFPPARHLGTMFFFALFAALCFLPVFIVPHDDWFGRLFTIPFVLFGAVLGLCAVGGSVIRTRLTADRDGVVVVRSFLGLPFTSRWRPIDIEPVTARQTMTVGNSAYYSLHVAKKGDSFGTDIGSGISGHATADRLAAVVLAAVQKR